MACAESEVSAESDVIKSKYVDGVTSLSDTFAHRSVRRSLASFSPNATIPAYGSPLLLSSTRNPSLSALTRAKPPRRAASSASSGKFTGIRAKPDTVSDGSAVNRGSSAEKTPSSAMRKIPRFSLQARALVRKEPATAGMVRIRA